MKSSDHSPTNSRIRSSKSTLEKLPTYLRIGKRKAKKYAGQTTEDLIDQLEALNSQVKQQQKQLFYRTFLLFGILFTLISFGGYEVISSIKVAEDAKAIEELSTSFSDKIYQYDQHLSSGNELMETMEWDKAAFHYMSAIEMVPHDLNAKKKLASCYTYKCLDINEQCNEAQDLINSILLDNPDDAEMVVLQSFLDSKRASFDEYNPPIEVN